MRPCLQVDTGRDPLTILSIILLYFPHVSALLSTFQRHAKVIRCKYLPNISLMKWSFRRPNVKRAKLPKGGRGIFENAQPTRVLLALRKGEGKRWGHVNTWVHIMPTDCGGDRSSGQPVQAWAISGPNSEPLSGVEINLPARRR